MSKTVRFNSWTKCELDVLRENVGKPWKDVAALLHNRTVKAVRSRAKLLGLHNRRNVPWTPHQLELLRRLYPHHKTEKFLSQIGHTLSATYRMAFKLGLEKTPEFLASVEACRLRRGDNIGAAFRFHRGNVPFNKGLRRPGWSAGRMRETQFHKGQKSKNYLPIGTERRDADGYWRVKIADGLGGFGNQKVWALKHRLVWQAANGPVPKGSRLWWRNGNRDDNRLENLELLTDAEHMARTTIHNRARFSPELAQVCQLKGVLKRRIREREERDAKKKQN